jgi:ABC-type Fe3+ transport system permease subunit
VSTPTPDFSIPIDPPLVEPASRPALPVDPESLDTQRILRDTTAIPVVTEDPAPPRGVETDAAMVNEAPPARMNALAVVSLVLALTASPLATLFGYIAVGQIRRAGQRGEGLAWTAVGLGWLWTVGYVVAGTVAALIWFDLS